MSVLIVYSRPYVCRDGGIRALTECDAGGQWISRLAIIDEIARRSPFSGQYLPDDEHGHQLLDAMHTACPEIRWATENDLSTIYPPSSDDGHIIGYYDVGWTPIAEQAIR